jgi:hypothetical protein
MSVQVPVELPVWVEFAAKRSVAYHTRNLYKTIHHGRLDRFCFVALRLSATKPVKSQRDLLAAGRLGKTSQSPRPIYLLSSSTLAGNASAVTRVQRDPFQAAKGGVSGKCTIYLKPTTSKAETGRDPWFPCSNP